MTAMVPPPVRTQLPLNRPIVLNNYEIVERMSEEIIVVVMCSGVSDADTPTKDIHIGTVRQVRNRLFGGEYEVSLVQRAIEIYEHNTAQTTMLSVVIPIGCEEVAS